MRVSRSGQPRREWSLFTLRAGRIAAGGGGGHQGGARERFLCEAGADPYVASLLLSARHDSERAARRVPIGLGKFVPRK